MNQADVAWMLICSALVLLMTPGLALFYGGLARSKNAAATVMHSFMSMGIVGHRLGALGLLAGLRPGCRPLHSAALNSWASTTSAPPSPGPTRTTSPIRPS